MDAITKQRRRFVLVGGGARSGKSSFALARGRALGARRTFIATARPGDDEMETRITRHREQRGEDYRTVEEPLELPAVVGAIDGTDVVVIDCLTLWISNLLERKDGDADVLAAIDRFADVVRRRTTHLVLVTNEVGMGLVPLTPIGRRFRDMVGFAHKRLTSLADEVHFAALGMILRLHPGPVEAHPAAVTP